MLRSWMCAQHHFLGILATGGQLLVLLHCSKVEIDGRRYGNRITFFSLVPRSQLHKKYKELHKKWVQPLRLFVLLRRHLQEMNWAWKLAKLFQTSRFSSAPHPQKRSNDLRSLCCRHCQYWHTCQFVAYVAKYVAKYIRKLSKIGKNRKCLYL